MTLLESCARRPRSSLASGRRASIDASHPGDVPHVCACGRDRQAMPRRSLSHPTCLQPPCASLWSFTWPKIVSRDRQLRSVRVLHIWLASMVPLVGSVVEELTDSKVVERSTCRRGPFGVHLWLVRSALNEYFSVETWASPACSGRIYMPPACPVGFKLNGERERACRAMPSIPSWDPISKSVM